MPHPKVKIIILEGKEIILLTVKQNNSIFSYQFYYINGYMFGSLLTILRPSNRNLSYTQCSFMLYGIPYYLQLH